MGLFRRRFKPGEKAKLVMPEYGKFAREATPYLGTEVTVLTNYRDMPHLIGGWGYTIITKDGLSLDCTHDCLERAPPEKKEPTASWSDVPFNLQIRAPKRVTESVS